MRELRAGRPLWRDLNSHGSAQTYPYAGGASRSRRGDRRGGMTGSTIAAMFAHAGLRVALAKSCVIGRESTVASTALLLRERTSA